MQMEGCHSVRRFGDMCVCGGGLMTDSYACISNKEVGGELIPVS